MNTRINPPAKVARRWSFQLVGVGSAFLAYLASDPFTLLTIWNYLPDLIKDRLPPTVVLVAPLLFFIAALGAMFIPQKGLQDAPPPGPEPE